MKDPIVEEINRIREKILSECDNDIEKFMDRLKARETRDKDRIVSPRNHKEKISIK